MHFIEPSFCLLFISDSLFRPIVCLLAYPGFCMMQSAEITLWRTHIMVPDHAMLRLLRKLYLHTRYMMATGSLTTHNARFLLQNYMVRTLESHLSTSVNSIHYFKMHVPLAMVNTTRIATRKTDILKLLTTPKMAYIFCSGSQCWNSFLVLTKAAVKNHCLVELCLQFNCDLWSHSWLGRRIVLKARHQRRKATSSLNVRDNK